MKNIIIVIGIIIIIVLGAYIFKGKSADNVVVNPNPTETPTPTPITPPIASTTEPTSSDKGPVEVIGKSVEGKDITAYHYGTGEKEILFVGGIHGGYSWNAALVAQELKDYLDKNPNVVPEEVKVTVIPVLNPDGLNKVVGTATGNFSASEVSTDQAVLTSGRFNANKVDLNRNFDCDWQAEAKWQNKDVSGGTAAFSEPEAQAIKTYVEANKPEAVVIYYAAAGGVYASSCHNGVSDGTKSIMNTYAKAAGYTANDSYDFYETTGDMANWLAKINVPAISVLLTNHTSTEWTKNKAGIEALIKSYAN